MSAEKLYSEILEDFEAAPDKSAKLKVLREHDHKMFREFLEAAFNPDIVFDVEIPNYKPDISPAGLNVTYLDMEMNKLYRFVKNHPKRTNVEPKKLTRLLEIILVSLHKDEAELLVKCIKKDIKVPFLTPKMIREAYNDKNMLGKAK
tara:strand:- start:330 stop:770 length:441 start_codon:yes stop_codon:yes gene_type:complete